MGSLDLQHGFSPVYVKLILLRHCICYFVFSVALVEFMVFQPALLRICANDIIFFWLSKNVLLLEHSKVHCLSICVLYRLSPFQQALFVIFCLLCKIYDMCFVYILDPTPCYISFVLSDFVLFWCFESLYFSRQSVRPESGRVICIWGMSVLSWRTRTSQLTWKVDTNSNVSQQN